MKIILVLLVSFLAISAHAAETNGSGSPDLSTQKNITASGIEIFLRTQTFLRTRGANIPHALRAICSWSGGAGRPYNNNDCGLFEARNTTTSSSRNASWAVSAANAYHSIPAGVTDTGERIGVMGWATSVNAHGLTHAGTLYEQNGLKGVAGFQGIGPLISPPSASVRRAVGVKGQILGESPGATIDNAYAGLFTSAPLASSIGNNYAVYASASGGTSNWAFYGDGGQFYNYGKSFFGHTFSQSSTAMASRTAGNSFEFGHPDPNGYGSSIGATFAAGFPFVAFSAEADPTGNTFTTRGKFGSVISGDLAGGIVFSRLPVASSTGQSLIETARFNARGNLVLSKHPPASSTDACTIGERAWDDSYIYVCVAENTWKRAVLSDW